MLNMKTFKLLIPGLLILAFSCKDSFIDDIRRVDPGDDVSAPVVNVVYPVEGTKIKVNEDVTSINLNFEVVDDIEIASVTVKIDDELIVSYDEFKDYRKFKQQYLYTNLTTGTHVLDITAVDIDGKTTTKLVNFEKEPAYVPIYDGEIFYMPFDGNFIELVSVSFPTTVGSPGFSSEAKAGTNSYAGAANGYLTFPSGELTATNEFSAAFWMKIDATPDRAGILVMGPPGINTRTQGFRLFRENAGGKQRFKLNVGHGAGENWFDGGANADVDPTTNEWVHLAFTISPTQGTVYINGNIVSQGAMTSEIDWTGCDILSIMSGAPRFSEWGHLSDESNMDELRLFDKALSQAEVQNIMVTSAEEVYEPKYDGEVFYMPFDGSNSERITKTSPTIVGTPGFAGESVQGADAYAGATDSYLTFPAADLTSDEFSAVFWMKIDATPDRAGVLVMGPPGDNIRTQGFRFFRENAGGKQRFKLNVGNGTADNWFDGGANADVDPTLNEWNHFAFTISGTECKVYINGTIVSEGAFAGVDWTGCDVLSIMSGAPRFMEWGHLSDESYMDELRIFNKALSQAEIQTIIDNEN